MLKPMTATWTATTATPEAQRSIIGHAPTAAQAARAVVTATDALINRGGDHHPRYTLHVGGALVATITTGAGEDGSPDHAGAGQLLAQLSHILQTGPATPEIALN